MVAEELGAHLLVRVEQDAPVVAAREPARVLLRVARGVALLEERARLPHHARPATQRGDR